METGLFVFLLRRAVAAGLLLAALALQGCGLFGGSKDEGPPPLGSELEAAEPPGPDASEQQVIEPQVARREIKEPSIGGEDFELGAYVGILSIEDFGSSSVFGLRFNHHVTESFYLEASVGQSKAGTTSYERLAGTVPLISDDKREYRYYALNVGWNALPGEVFIGKGIAYNSAFYFTLGVGGTDFAGDNHFTANAGFGYRILFSRFMAAHFDFRDYLFDSDLLGEKKVVNNLEGSLSLSFFF